MGWWRATVVAPFRPLTGAGVAFTPTVNEKLTTSPYSCAMVTRNVTCKTLPVRRADGQSAVAGAAYRAGEALYDERREARIDYAHRQPDVWHSEILAPEGAPDWALDRERLWNRAEAAEIRKDGRPARDVILGCAWELRPEVQREMVISWVRAEFVAKGHVADVAFHRYGQRVTDASDEGRATLRRWAAHNVPFLERDECVALWEPLVKVERHDDGTVIGYKIDQPHVHCYVTPRAIDEDGFAAKRNRDLDRAEQAMAWRYEWPRHQNAFLKAEGIDVEVSATTANHPDDLPYKSESLSQAAYHLEQRGEHAHERKNVELHREHNEAVRQAAIDQTVSQEAGEGGRFAQVRAWWQSMRGHFDQFREQIRERFGRSPAPTPAEPPVQTAQAAEPAQQQEASDDGAGRE